MLKAIIFDADGTLLDSFELVVSAYKHIAETHHLRVPTAEEVRAQMGKSIPDILRGLYPDADYDIKALLHTNSEYVAANAMKSEAFEGVDDLLRTLQESGLKLAILTSGGPRIAQLLAHHKLDSYFSSVVHHERIHQPKPDPEGFLLAISECGAAPEEAIMVGDTIVDIQTGKNAGALAAIAITHGHGLPEDLVTSGADYVVDSLDEVKDVILKHV